MAQPPNSSGISLHPLIQSNCHVFLGNHVDLDVITRVDTAGNWTAHVLKTERSQRSVVLGEAGSTPEEALERLHRKTAQAVDNYVSANGFGLPQKVTMRPSKRGGEGDGASGSARGRLHQPLSPAEELEHAEVISLGSDSSLSESEASNSDSDDDGPHHVGAAPRRWRVMRPTSSSAHMAVRRGELWDRALAHRPRVEMPAPGAAAYRPVGPGFSLPPPPPPPPAPRTRVVVSPPPECAAQEQPATPEGLQPIIHQQQQQQKACHSMALCIRFAGVGDLTVVETLPLSRHAIVDRAVHIVQTRTSEFRTNTDTLAPTTALAGLNAVVSKLSIGGVTLDMSRLGDLGDDLSGLFSSPPNYPRFEIIVLK